MAMLMIADAQAQSGGDQGGGTPASVPAASVQRNDLRDPALEDSDDAVKKEPIRIDPGEKRPADQFTVDLFGRPLTIGGRYELDPRYIEDRKLDPAEGDDIANVSQEIQLEFYYPWSKAMSVFIQSSFLYNPELYSEDHNTKYERDFKLGQAWMFLNQVFDSNFSLQIGRQKFADKRQWWWDEKLDAMRLYFAHDNVFAEFSAAEEIGSKRTDRDFVDPIHDNVFRMMGDLIWQWDEKHNVGLFFLSQFDHSKTQRTGQISRQEQEDKHDDNLTWIGARAMGKFKLTHQGKIAYWLDSASVFGEETNIGFSNINDALSRVDSRSKKHVLGWGIDAGVTWYSKWPLNPYFTLGYARGSGDSNPRDGTDTAYRQSGLQGNKIKLGGSQRFRYYGELFRPELSNLEIVTAAIGFPLSEESSIDFLYHHYNQAHASNTIRDARIRATPNGLNSDLGDEFDLVLSLDEWKHVQAQVVGSLFKADDAFGKFSGNTSFMIETTFKYSF